jgi:hypothetical protein
VKMHEDIIIHKVVLLRVTSALRAITVVATI